MPPFRVIPMNHDSVSDKRIKAIKKPKNQTYFLQM